MCRLASSGLEALRRFALDLVVGGIDSSTPWSKTVGLTWPYFTERIVVGVPAGMKSPDSLEGMRVEVLGSAEAAEYLRHEHATPVRVAASQVSGPAAGPDWQLRELGLVPTKFEIVTLKHVIVGPPGENAWLQRLQQFLALQSAGVPALLQQSGAGQ